MADPKNDTALSAYLEAHANDAQLLLEVLCRQPSVVAQNLGMAEMADLIETLLGEIGFQTQRLLRRRGTTRHLWRITWSKRLHDTALQSL